MILSLYRSCYDPYFSLLSYIHSIGILLPARTLPFSCVIIVNSAPHLSLILKSLKYATRTLCVCSCKHLLRMLRNLLQANKCFRVVLLYTQTVNHWHIYNFTIYTRLAAVLWPVCAARVH